MINKCGKTLYCVHFGKNPNVFLAIADNNIPLKFLGRYSDILNSFIYENFISEDLLPIVKKICSDTKKEAILNINHSNEIIKEITNHIISCDITWKNCSRNSWNNFINGVVNYCQDKDVIMEIDHPINFKDKMLVQIIEKGLLIKFKKDKEIQESFKQIRKKVRSSLKKNGK